MADISKLKIEGTVYDIKDVTARTGLADISKNEEIYSPTQPSAGVQNVGAFWTQVLS